MDPTELGADISPDINMGLNHEAPLSHDSVPDANQAHYCFSCKTPIKGLYCNGCGQKNDDFRRSIFSLLKEFFGSLTGIENRMWRTWFALLFKPGKVAREFADGARSKWSSPVRAFLAMSIILFGFMSFTGTQLVSVDLHPVLKENVTTEEAARSKDDYTYGGGIYFFESRKAMERRTQNTDYALLEAMLLDPDTGGMSIDIGTDDASVEPGEDPEAEEDAVHPVLENLEIGGGKVDAADGLKQFIAIVQDPREVNAVFYTWLPRIMFLMMPFSMFIGALFIRGRGNALLYDHLVHAAYIHAVVYFLVFVGIIASRILHGAPIAIAIFAGLMIYLPLSLRRMFQRGWFKTVWTAYGVGFIYFLTIFVILLALLVMGVAKSMGALA